MRFTPSAASLLFALGLPVVASAQATVDTLSLTGRNALMFGVGLTSGYQASATPSTSAFHRSGETASFGFTHWVRPDVAVLLSGAVLNVDATVAVSGRMSSDVVTPILFGVSYSPRALALSRSIRPYFSGAVGPYMRSASEAGFAWASASSESVPGARAAVGANWFVARHFLMSFDANYHAVRAFENGSVIRDPSGFGMSLGLGFSWGGRY